jgi:hypothetical protein
MLCPPRSIPNLYNPQTGSPVTPVNDSSFSRLISDVGEAWVYGGVHFQ